MNIFFLLACFADLDVFGAFEKNVIFLRLIIYIYFLAPMVNVIYMWCGIL